MPRAHPEKNKNNQKEIMAKIAQIKEMNRDFLSVIGKHDHLPRDKLVELDYLEKFEKQAPWLKKRGEVIEENQEKTLIKKLLFNIEASPKKRNKLIKQFLEQNSAIEKADREILIKSYENLPSETLEKEIKNILEIFGK